MRKSNGEVGMFTTAGLGQPVPSSRRFLVKSHQSPKPMESAMRHGILASVAVLTLICLAVGDEPKRLDAETDEGMIERDRTDLDIQIDDLQARLDDLKKEQRRAHQRGVKHELFVQRSIDDTERYLYQLQAEQKRRLAEGHPSDELNKAGRYVEHIRIAAKHLNAAGMHDLAHNMTEKADAMEQEVGEAKERRAKRLEDFRRQYDTLRSQMEEHERECERLQREMNELKYLMSKE